MNKIFFALIIATTVILTGCKNEDDKTVDLAGITLSQNSVYLKPGDKVTLSVTFFPSDASNQSIDWTTSDPTVATVTDGVVTAVGAGYATITATSKADNSYVQTCTVGVMSNDVKTVSGAVEGTWQMGTTINVTDNIYVPAGKTLTIEEGVEIIFNIKTPAIEFCIEGNIYCQGSDTYPVLFSVDPTKRVPADNAYNGFWGGITLGNTCDEALFDHAVIEYAGGNSVTGARSLSYGYKLSAGDPECAITGGKLGGRYVITNSILRYMVDNAFYMWGGNYIIANNLIAGNGKIGGDAIAPKSGCVVDACYNVIFAPNTNGLKLSSSGEGATAPQGIQHAYNNTIINAGWRRNGDKGGSIYIEKNVLASVFNNLMVNCKFRVQTPTWNNPNPSNGADQASIIDYNFYASGSQQSTFAQDNPNFMTSYAGYTSNNANYWFDGQLGTPKVDEHAIVCASAGDAATDPKFVNYGFNSVPLGEFVYNDAWDFHVQAGSPALAGAQSNFTGNWTGKFTTAGLAVGGKEYKSPAPSARFGALGTN